MRRIHFVIDSDLADVSLVAVAVHGVCIHLGFSKMEAGEVELCVAEAVTNSIRHSYRGRLGHNVSISLSIHAGQMHIDISDTGASMSSDEVERLVKGTRAADLDTIDIASLPESGRGLQIIRDLMDEVVYIREAEINRLHLIRRMPGAAEHGRSLHPKGKYPD
jgi:serine/threonine-protein kinase RsbW